jgi:hypothetical protein
MKIEEGLSQRVAKGRQVMVDALLATWEGFNYSTT